MSLIGTDVRPVEGIDGLSLTRSKNLQVIRGLKEFGWYPSWVGVELSGCGKFRQKGGSLLIQANVNGSLYLRDAGRAAF